MIARALIPLLAFVVPASSVGCRAFDASLLRDGGVRDGGPRDGGPRDAPPGSMDAGPGCALHRPPAPAGGEGSGPEVTFALRHILLDQGEEWRRIGYDLDGFCTQSVTDPSECAPRTADAPREIDGVGGTDNSFGHQFAPFLLIADDRLAEEAMNDSDKGIGVILVTVRGWNGMPDDSSVDVIVMQSVFGTPALPDGGRPDPVVPDGGIIYDDGGMPPLPRWEGRDWWWVRHDNFLDSDPSIPLLRDDRAYVSGGTIVVRLPGRVPIVLAGSVRSSIFKLTGTTLTLRLSGDTRAVDEAILAGRWSIADGLEAAPYAGICVGTENYNRVRRLADLSADIRSMPGEPNPAVPCDAISFALRFDGVRAFVGGVTNLHGLPNPCDDDAGVPMDAGP